MRERKTHARTPKPLRPRKPLGNDGRVFVECATGVCDCESNAKVSKDMEQSAQRIARKSTTTYLRNSKVIRRHRIADAGCVLVIYRELRSLRATQIICQRVRGVRRKGRTDTQNYRALLRYRKARANGGLVSWNGGDADANPHGHKSHKFGKKQIRRCAG